MTTVSEFYSRAFSPELFFELRMAINIGDNERIREIEESYNSKFESEINASDNPEIMISTLDVVRQWTDESGYTWRSMSDGSTQYWNGVDWQKR